MAQEDTPLEAPVPMHVASASFTDSPNARSKTVTTAVGSDTHGTLNQHLQGNAAFQVGVHDDRGQRRTMEDAYSFIVDFASIRGQGYFAVFDGHAGKYAAEWCGQHFHEHLLECLRQNPDSQVPDVLNKTFHSVDSALSSIAENDDKMHSGCTAVTAFLRLEDAQGKQSFLPAHYDFGRTAASIGGAADSSRIADSPTNDAYPTPDSSSPSPSPSPSPGGTGKRKNKRASRLVDAFKSLSGSSTSKDTSEADGHANPTHSSVPSSRQSAVPSSAVGPLGNATGGRAEAFVPNTATRLRRVLYTANAGDARAVLSRAGKAVRLTYDHKGNDKQEAKRIMDAGGFVMGGRVNGILAVTRSLGDSSMKEYVVGSPYTTETELSDDDEFLIIACDGVWDVMSDQDAVDLIKEVRDAQEASRMLVEQALKESTDNITALVIRFPAAPPS